MKTLNKISKFLFVPIIIYTFGILLISCNQSVPKTESAPNFRDSLDLEQPVKEEPKLVITYQIDSLETVQEADSLFNNLSAGEQKLLFALNRIERVRVGAGTKLIIPDTLITDLMAYTPFPTKLNLLDSIPKSVMIAQRIQAFALYENGTLIKWGPVSSGKASTPTPNGLHYGNYKAKRKVSTVNSDWILPYYFNFMNFEGVGVHQYLLPGFPASHACVRLDMDDAKYIYDWAKQWELNRSKNVVVKNGTPFMVFGEYNYEEQSPWLNLAIDPFNNELTAGEMETIEEYVRNYRQDPRNVIEEVEVLDAVLAVR